MLCGDCSVLDVDKCHIPKAQGLRARCGKLRRALLVGAALIGHAPSRMWRWCGNRGRKQKVLQALQAWEHVDSLVCGGPVPQLCVGSVDGRLQRAR